MAAYRLYFIGLDGHFVRVVQLDHPDDEAAIADAERQGDGRPMELWNFERRVHTFSAGPERVPRGPRFQS
jgi:hypothetical protein